MKKHLFLILSLLIICGLCGCKSKKQTLPIEPQTPEQDVPTWQNVRVPVTMILDQPMQLTLNGTLTMVRGEYVLISFRTFGFEVATAYATPDRMDMVMKMPSKLWISEPLTERLKNHNINFADLQDALLSNTLQPKNLPDGVDIKVGGSKEKPEISLSMTNNKSKVTVTVSFNYADAVWNVDNPARFSAPGAGYTKLGLKDVAKFLPK